MPGRHEQTDPGFPQSLNVAACTAAPDAVETVPSRGRSIALLAVLISACTLVLTPAVVAAISMIDPRALDQTLSWFQPLSPIPSLLDDVKLVLAAGAVAAVSSGRRHPVHLGVT